MWRHERLNGVLWIKCGQSFYLSKLCVNRRISSILTDSFKYFKTQSQCKAIVSTRLTSAIRVDSPVISTCLECAGLKAKIVRRFFSISRWLLNVQYQWLGWHSFSFSFTRFTNFYSKGRQNNIRGIYLWRPPRSTIKLLQNRCGSCFAMLCFEIFK